MKTVIKIDKTIDNFQEVEKYINKKLSSFCNKCQFLNALLKIDVLILCKQPHQYEVQLNFSSKYYNFTAQCSGDNFYTGIDYVITKLLKEEKQILYILQKETSQVPRGLG